MFDIAIIAACIVFVLTVLFIRTFIFPLLRSKLSKESVFQEGMANGGVGSLGRCAGRVEVEVRGGSSGVAAVCISRELNVMYWWRASGENGYNLIGDSGDVTERAGRAVIAAIRLWGKSWENADRVDICSNSVSNAKLKMLVQQQVEDCQNKYGVRVRWSDDADPVREEVYGPESGARDLVNQLMAGRGAGQDGEGFHNIHLRVTDENVFQLVNHTDKLLPHYFHI